MNHKKRLVPQIVGKDVKLPFSTGILINSLETVGVNLARAQAIAEKIEKDLLEENVVEIGRKEFRARVYSHIKEIDKKVAEKYIKFRKIMELEDPLIVLLGGSTGSGKNAVSVELAHRLDIMNVITSDIIREIMRSLFSDEILPMIHTSSYLAYKKLWMPLKEEKHQETVAFREQALRVNAGIKGIIKRSIQERASLIINGVHILPDIVTPKEFKGANVVKVFIYIKDEKEHRKRFYIRGLSSEERAADKYLGNFKTIRMIQSYIIKRAKASGYLCIDNRDVKQTALKVIDHIIDKISPRDKG